MFWSFFGDHHELISNLDSTSYVKVSIFVKCQVKMKAYPGELLILALEMVCLVPSTGGLERFNGIHPLWFSQQAQSSKSWKTYICDAIFEW